MNVKKAAGTVTIWTSLSKIFGYIRESVIAYFFGASTVVDAFLVASLIPNTLVAILANGFPAAMTSLYKELYAKDKKMALRFVSLLSGLFIITAVLLIIILWFGAPLVVRALAPGFSHETSTVTIRLAVMLLPMLFLSLMGKFACSLLYANDIFALPTFATVLLPNIVLIGAIVLTAKFWGIKSMVLGLILGWMLALLIQFFRLYRIGLRVRVACFWRDLYIKRFGLLIVPVLLSSGITYVYLFIDRILASGLAEGSISSLNFAGKVSMLPENIFAFSLGAVILPALSALAARHSYEEMAVMTRKGFNTMLFLAAPCAAGLFVLAEPITRLLFFRGAFDETDLVMTASALMAFSLGVMANCINPIMIRTFFALQETRVPVITSIISLAVKLIVSLILIPSLGHTALALGDSAAVSVCTVVLLILLHRRLPSGLVNPKLFFSWGKIFLAVGMMTGMVYLVNIKLSLLLSGSGGTLIRLVIAIFTGAAGYAGLSLILKIKEFDLFLDFIHSHLKKKSID
ncbi:MAG: murein biosynthesis integral membrane protein MurJ [Desulfitobacteriaceae bacterium]|nr:murein biosynthesis integral membrane protein MurJ [Desulfitobacteriaceae bacterium]MDD4752093.1 murein biosynthesis integral membrane protein MurJ [Desulfitobacteriaceae bacterium]